MNASNTYYQDSTGLSPYLIKVPVLHPNHIVALILRVM